MKLTVHQANQHSKEDCPDIDYYAADRIVNQHDPIEFQVAVGRPRTAWPCKSLRHLVPQMSTAEWTITQIPISAWRSPPRPTPFRQAKRMPARRCSRSGAEFITLLSVKAFDGVVNSEKQLIHFDCSHRNGGAAFAPQPITWSADSIAVAKISYATFR